ncbi:Na/Pi symporter [Tuberibacillus calidus]|jgi:phosphate:Na+ symporter|uniref:Na/Pi symporter n=1 Tax=Tuberibacillus calidus TaxID=340097 RepID=UPI00040FE2F4|nr:Na/Pi symporter [Tuberibacillus calidus]
MFTLISTFIIYITIFFFGMTVMRIGMLNASEDRLKMYLYRVTDKPIKGLFFGMILTAAMQSSSAVTVIAIGLVSAKLISFQQTIGVILGSNIGTTVTGEIATIDLGSHFWVLLVLGVVLMFLPYQKAFVAGTFSFGLGSLFCAMNGFQSLAGPVENLASMRTILDAVNHSLALAIIVGCVFTAIIQSSAATQLLVMGLATADLLTLPASFAIVLGANIGTCMTALLAALPSGKPARYTAYTHTLFNFLGVLLFYPILPIFADGVAKVSRAPDQAIAHMSVLFNVITAFLALPFANSYGRWVDKILNR